jgi:hypothetical protein
LIEVGTRYEVLFGSWPREVTTSMLTTGLARDGGPVGPRQSWQAGTGVAMAKAERSVTAVMIEENMMTEDDAQDRKS